MVNGQPQEGLIQKDTTVHKVDPDAEQSLNVAAAT